MTIRSENRPSFASVAVRSDLRECAGLLRTLAQEIHAEAFKRGTETSARRHLEWATAEVDAWADEALGVEAAGDELDRRAALDTALTRRAIATQFLAAWRSPLGRWS